ncbi:DNA circularization N-terminal domain-containing protein [Kistimonas scapharcae]|uniref:DNA circularization N-terminal domain-containing protein n=1 Tax=Kistimonas scapharcae TaxID=1036133 RepID=A0ABP8V797_9GAMM
MSWRERMLPGSFRGVPFYCESHSEDGGRRVAVHQYPLRDKPYAEDLGRKAGERSLECLVIGADYMDARDALKQVFAQKGPGELVHPWQGTMMVQLTGFSLRESTREGGCARFSIRFVEAGGNDLPTVRPDTGAHLQQSCGKAWDMSQSNLAQNYQVKSEDKSWPDQVLAQATAMVEGVLNKIRAVTGGIIGQINGLQDIVTDLVELAAEPGKLFIAIQAELLAIAAWNPLAALGVYENLFDYWGGYDDWDAGDYSVPPYSSTVIEARTAANERAVATLVADAALVSAVQTLATLTPDSAEQAAAWRLDWSDRIGDRLLSADPVMTTALTGLRQAMVVHLDSSAARLPQTATLNPVAVEPAVVIAYRELNDASRADDLVRRNTVSHPSFVPVKPLEVLYGD